MPGVVTLATDEGSAGQPHGADDLRHAHAGPDADGQPRHVGRHAAAHLRLPVASLQQRPARAASTSAARPARPTRSTATDVGSTIRVVVTPPTPPARQRHLRADGRRSPACRRSTRCCRRSPARRSDGQTLTAANGTWTGTAPITYTYQWRRCNSAGASCANIAGATASTYALVAADVGSTIRVVVTGTNAAGNSSATSSQTAVVAAGAAGQHGAADDLRHGAATVRR